MATSNLSLEGYSGHFEELYNKTVIKSPIAKLCSEELPKSKGMVRKYFLSPVAKIIQQMKMTTNGKNQAPGQQPGKEVANARVTRSNNKPTTTETNKRKSDELPSFDCSDISSESSSDMSDDEEQNPPVVQGGNHGNKASNLHKIVQKHKSPEKRTPSIASKLNQEQKTPPADDLRIPASIKDLQKSLTPEFKAMARKASSVQSDNSEYRNKKIDIQESSQDGDDADREDDQVVDEDDDGVEEQPAAGVGDQSMSMGRRTRQNGTEIKAVNNVAIEEPDEMTTPSTHTTAVLQKSQQEPDDETPKNSRKASKSQSEQDDETPKIQKLSKSQSSSEVILDNWFIQMAPKCKGLRVQGHRSCDPPDTFWNSSAITQRVNKSTVTTQSGTVYKLVGKMDRALAREEGFGVKIVKQFHNGFPVNWKECMSEFIHESIQKTSKRAAATPVVNCAMRKEDMKTSGKRLTKDAMTPVNTVLIRELPRSRSGRMIKPPLAYWTNQRVRHNVSTDCVEIIAGGTDHLPSNVAETKLKGSTELTPYEHTKMRRTRMRELKKSESRSKPKRRKLTDFTDSEADSALEASADDADTDNTVPVENPKQTSQRNARQSKQRQGKSVPEASANDTDTDSTVPAENPKQTSQRKAGQSQRGQGKRGRPKKHDIAKADSTSQASADDTDTTVPEENPKQTLQRKAGQSKQKQGKRGRPKKQDIDGKRQTRNIMKKQLAQETENSNSESESEAGLRKNKETRESVEEGFREPPAPPRKTRKLPAGSDSTNIPGTIRSPLYYTLSPDVTSDNSDSTPAIQQPLVGITPTAAHPSIAALKGTEADKDTPRTALLKSDALENNIELQLSNVKNKMKMPKARSSLSVDKDTPRTANLKSNALENNIGLQLSDVKKKMKVPKVLGSSPFNLQQEVMSVVMKQKQKRLARMAERRSSGGSVTGIRLQSPDSYNLDNTSDESPDILSTSKRGVRASSTSEFETSDSDFTKLVKSKATRQNGLGSKLRLKVNSNDNRTQSDSIGSVGTGTRSRSAKRGRNIGGGIAENQQRATRKSTLSAKNYQRTTRSSSSSAKNQQRATRKRTLSAQNHQRTTRSRSSSAESQQRATRKRTVSAEIPQRTTHSRSSSAESCQRSTRSRSTSANSGQRTTRNRSSSAGGRQRQTRNRTRQRSTRNSRNGREVVRKSTQYRNRTNAEVESDDLEDLDDFAKPSTKSNNQKVSQRKGSRKRISSKAVDVITIDSEDVSSSASKNNHRASSKLPNKQAKRRGTITIEDSESENDSESEDASESEDDSKSEDHSVKDNHRASAKLPSKQGKQRGTITIEGSESDDDSTKNKRKTSSGLPSKQAKRRGTITIEDTNSGDDFASEQDGSKSTTSSRLPARGAKRKAAEKIALMDSGSSSTEMMSIKASLFYPKPQPNRRKLLKAKRTVKASDQKISAAAGDAASKKVVDTTAGKENATAERSETDWTPEELAKLRSAIEVVKPDTPMYWQCVADAVETKSAQLCQQKHHESLEKTISNVTKQKKADEKKQVSKEPVQLTAKRGTMKRKRQLRELVEQHNKGHEADYFNSTPFKVQNKRIKISTELDSDDEDEGLLGSFQTPGTRKLGKTPGSSKYKTPSARPWMVAPLSDKKTPATGLLSPLPNVDRNHIDTYINGIKKKKKGRTLMPQSTPMMKKAKAKTKADLSMEEAVNQANAAGLFDAKPASDGSDSDASEDYYWSEDEQD